MKSLRRTGIFTAAAISRRYSSLPRKKSGSVRQEMAAAPAASYSRAIDRYGNSAAISPLDGEAFFTSQIKEMPGAPSAFSNG